MRPVDHDLVGVGEPRRGGEPGPRVADGDVVAEEAADGRDGGGEVDRAEDQHPRPWRERGDEHADVVDADVRRAGRSGAVPVAPCCEHPAGVGDDGVVEARRRRWCPRRSSGRTSTVAPAWSPSTTVASATGSSASSAAAERVEVDVVGRERLDEHLDGAAAGQPDRERLVVGDAVPDPLRDAGVQHLGGDLDDGALDAAAGDAADDVAVRVHGEDRPGRSWRALRGGDDAWPARTGVPSVLPAPQRRRAPHARGLPPAPSRTVRRRASPRRLAAVRRHRTTSCASRSSAASECPSTSASQWGSAAAMPPAWARNPPGRRAGWPRSPGGPAATAARPARRGAVTSPVSHPSERMTTTAPRAKPRCPHRSRNSRNPSPSRVPPDQSGMAAATARIAVSGSRWRIGSVTRVSRVPRVNTSVGVPLPAGGDVGEAQQHVGVAGHGAADVDQQHHPSRPVTRGPCGGGGRARPRTAAARARCGAGRSPRVGPDPSGGCGGSRRACANAASSRCSSARSRSSRSRDVAVAQQLLARRLAGDGAARRPRARPRRWRVTARCPRAPAAPSCDPAAHHRPSGDRQPVEEGGEHAVVAVEVVGPASTASAGPPSRRLARSIAPSAPSASTKAWTRSGSRPPRRPAASGRTRRPTRQRPGRMPDPGHHQHPAAPCVLLRSLGDLRPRRRRRRGSRAWPTSMAPHAFLVLAELQHRPERGGGPVGVEVVGAERDQRLGPVERLGDPGWLEQVLLAQRLDRGGRPRGPAVRRPAAAAVRTIATSRSKLGCSTQW